MSVERFERSYLEKLKGIYGPDDEFINKMYYRKTQLSANPDTVISVLKNQIGGVLPRIPMKFNQNEKKFENYFQN